MRTLFLYITFKVLWRFFFSVIIGVRFIGSRKFNGHIQFIVASNHNSHADAVTLMTAIPNNKLSKTRPVAAADYFGRNKFISFVSWLFLNLVLIPRKRAKDNKEDDPIQIMNNVLKKGNSLILFPEGSRGESGKIQPFKKGIGFLMEKNREVPVIPVYMEGIGRVLPKGNKIILPSLTKIYVGDAVYFKKESPAEITKIIEQKVLALKEKSAKYKQNFN
ncbi:1-acyl-sn-glycerol-3-phosphate acyltransferase [Crocinitomicaceae bacterium]|nr:1-acyl-sn-glycerol-3-phosphate acyltransferase [Crocinitomicaceae bacterium]MDC1203422.1 1-acyl-sn-glycerol-3-phosphate acyltransferase [Crocinitomicaceae bacterium]